MYRLNAHHKQKRFLFVNKIIELHNMFRLMKLNKALGRERICL